jgi:hypothetical protein
MSLTKAVVGEEEGKLLFQTSSFNELYMGKNVGFSIYNLQKHLEKQ